MTPAHAAAARSTRSAALADALLGEPASLVALTEAGGGTRLAGRDARFDAQGLTVLAEDPQAL